MAVTIEIPLETATGLVELSVHGHSCQGFTPIHDEQLDMRRWVSVHQLIVRRESDNTLWQLVYEWPLTEYQSVEFFDGDDPVTATQVVAREVTTTTYEVVTHAQEVIQ